MRRHADVALRRRHQRAGVVVDDGFAPQVAQKGAHRGELARRRRPRLPLLVKVGEKTAQRRSIEPRRIEIAFLDVGLRGRESDELRQIALVGADRVRRRIAVEREKFQERPEVFDHTNSGRCRDDFGTT